MRHFNDGQQSEPDVTTLERSVVLCLPVMLIVNVLHVCNSAGNLVGLPPLRHSPFHTGPQQVQESQVEPSIATSTALREVQELAMRFISSCQVRLTRTVSVESATVVQRIIFPTPFKCSMY